MKEKEVEPEDRRDHVNIIFIGHVGMLIEKKEYSTVSLVSCTSFFYFLEPEIKETDVMYDLRGKIVES